MLFVIRRAFQKNPTPRFYKTYKFALLQELPAVLLSALVLLFLPGFLSAQQCTLPSHIFLPDEDSVLFELLGRSVDIDGQYLVAGISENSETQVYSGKVLVYKLDTSNSWVRIAELLPSDPGKYRQFGSEVAIAGNSIVVGATEYNDTGFWRHKLYVFEMPSEGEWVSTTESYIITKDFGEAVNYSGYGAFEMNSSELVCFGAELGTWRLEVYKKDGGVFSRTQTIDLPETSWGGAYEWNLAVTDDLIAIGTEQFENTDKSTGAVFIYEKTGDSYNPSPVLLKASEQSATVWRGFGINLAAHGQSVFVLGLRNSGDKYLQTFYVFEKPASGWKDESRPALLEREGYVFYYSDMIASENYIIATGENYESVVGYRKSGTSWNSSAVPFEIEGVKTDVSVTGWQIAFNDTHLVLGCPGRFLFDGQPEEFLADYYSSTGEWIDLDTIPNQVIEYTSVNATDDFFGKVFSVFNNQIAISADGDDTNGWDTGVVYVFDAGSQEDTPNQKIFNPENENHTGFGRAIAMGDSVMFIGAPFKDSISADGDRVFYNGGKVYVYRLGANGWQYSSQIVGPNAHAEMTFGIRVVWSEGYCAVTEFYSGSSESVGRVHIYKENLVNGKFEYIATLDPAQHLRSDFFGNSMVMTDSMMVIGTGAGAPNSSYRQSAYVFMKKGEWRSATEDARLTSSDVGWADRHGASVSMYGDYIVVGAPYSPGFDPRPIPRGYIIPGAAYIYKRPVGGWKGVLTEMAKLSPSDPTDFGTFGTSVIIDHNDIFVGSPNVYAQYNYTDKVTNDNGRHIPGKVYHYTKPLTSEWKSTTQEKRQLQSFEPEIIDGYGASMFVSDRYLYVGVMLDDTDRGFRTGSVQTMMQLPAIDYPPVLCIDQPSVKLKGFPKGGQWSGTGVDASGTFSPADAGPGTHTITYQHSGCETSVVIDVLPSEMIVHNQSPPVQTKCIGQSIPIAFESNEWTDNYKWYYRASADLPLQKYDSLKQVIHADKAGYFEVIVTRGACPARKEIFRILDDPAVDIYISPVPLICQTSEVKLDASPTNGSWTGPGISESGTFAVEGMANGTYTLKYNVTTNVGCLWTDSVEVVVDILKQPGLVYNGEPICGDVPVTLSVTNTDGTTALAWWRDGVDMNAGMTDSIETTTPGQYKVVAGKGNCQLETVTIDVPREDNSITFEPAAVCSDETLALEAAPEGGTWQGTSVSAEGLFNPVGVANGVYALQYTVTTDVGCTWESTFQLAVDRLEVPSLTTDVTAICINRPATLRMDNVDDRSVIDWYGPDGEKIADVHASTYKTNKPGQYFADVTKGACTLRTPVVELVPEPDSVFVPNVFTANGDGLNDDFEVRVEGIEEMQLLLFNRYGRQLFETTDADFSWAATGVSSGIYFWSMSYRTCINTEKVRKGWVQVIR